MSEQMDKLARLENLMEKINQIEEKTPQDTETERIANTLEQIMLKIEAIHNQKLKQEAANKKLEQILNHMENTIGEGVLPQEQQGKPPLEETIREFLKTAQSSGKVLDLLAGSLMIVLEAAVKVIKSGSSSPLSLASPAKSNPQPDFSNILAALNSYVQSLNSEGAK
ncbi:MAG: hypothetical protein ACOX2G_06195 [Bacillota bacterium]